MQRSLPARGCGAAAVLMAAALAGCAAPQGPPVPPADAATPGGDLVHQVVSWSQPGLFARFPTDRPRDGWGTGFAPPSAGLPFHDADLAARWGNLTLHEVTWRAPPPEGAVERVVFQEMRLHRLEYGPRVAAMFDDVWGEAEVKGAFLAFARNTSGASEDALRAAVDAFWASGQHHADGSGPRGDFTVRAYEGALPEPWRLEALLAGLRANGSVEERKGLGGAGFEGQGWGFAFDLATKRADRQDAGVQRRFVVDGADDAAYSRSGGEPLGRAELEDEVRTAFEALGLGEPDLAGARFHDGAGSA